VSAGLSGSVKYSVTCRKSASTVIKNLQMRLHNQQLSELTDVCVQLLMDSGTTATKIQDKVDLVQFLSEAQMFCSTDNFLFLYWLNTQINL